MLVAARVAPIPFPINRPSAVIDDLEVHVRLRGVVENPVFSRLREHFGESHLHRLLDRIPLLSHRDLIRVDDYFVKEIEVMLLMRCGLEAPSVGTDPF